MPATVNKVILMGTVGRMPSWSMGPRGTHICHVALATDDVHMDWRTGAEVPTTHWHRIVLTGQIAQAMWNRLAKGDSLYVTGRMQRRKAVDQNGKPQHINEVLAIDVQVYPKPRQSPRDNRPGGPKLTDPDIAAWIASYDHADARTRADSASMAVSDRTMTHGSGPNVLFRRTTSSFAD